MVMPVSVSYSAAVNQHQVVQDTTLAFLGFSQAAKQVSQNAGVEGVDFLDLGLFFHILAVMR